MDEECIKDLFSQPLTKELLKPCVVQILKKVEMLDVKMKIMLQYKGHKVGYLVSNVPIEDIKILRYWHGPFGIKVELSYNDKFVGVLMISK